MKSLLITVLLTFFCCNAWPTSESLVPGDEDTPKLPSEKKIRQVTQEEVIAGLLPLAEKGDVKAMLSLAFEYHLGLNGHANILAGRGWFEKAAELGDRTAQAELTMSYLAPDNEDLLQAYLWASILAAGELEDELAEVGKTARRIAARRMDVEELAKAQEKCDEWERTHPERAAKIGKLVEDGSRVFSEAQLERSALAGDVVSMRYLARRLVHHKPDAERSKNSLRWYEKAAKLGDLDSKMELATRYGLGFHAPEDTALSYMWANLAAASGDKKSIEFLNRLSRHMSPEQIAEGQRLTREWNAKYEPQAP
jgi:TPR repeat protein